MVDLAAVRADCLDRWHLHDDALHVLGRNDGTAFIAAVFRCIADDLDQAPAAIRAEFFVGDDFEGVGRLFGSVCRRRRRYQARDADLYLAFIGHDDGPHLFVI